MPDIDKNDAQTAPMFGKRDPVVDITHHGHSIQEYFNIPESFDSATHARSCLDYLASGVFRLRGDLMALAERDASCSPNIPFGPTRCQCYIQALSRSVGLNSDCDQIIARKHALQHGMSSFLRAMEKTTELSRNSVERPALAVRIQAFLTWFTLVNCRETREIECDRFRSMFKLTIDLAEKYVLTGPSDAFVPQRRTLSFEPGVIPAIYLVANKCRDPLIRNKAIQLLAQSCRQEAIWDGKPFAAYMKRLAELEERVAVQDSGRSAFLDSRPKIPEDARFVEAIVANDLDDKGRGRLVCARYRHEADGTIELTEHYVHMG